MPFRPGFLLALALSSFSLISPAHSQEDPDTSQVIVTVNGTEITLGHMLALRGSLPPHYSQIPTDTLYKGVLDQLIQQTLLMQSRNGTSSKRSKLQIENETRAIIASEAISEVMGTQLNEADVQAAFNEQYAIGAAEPEYKAAHILVESEEAASVVRQQISDGANFADMAREHSTGPSGPSGGALGWFGAGTMVEPFFDAVVKLEPGEVSPPVQTQFGWHLILLEEVRAKERPALEDVREEIESQLRQAAFEAYLGDLEGAAKIELPAGQEIDPAIINRTDLLEK